MDCRRFQSEGMRLLDGEASLEERRAYEKHLETCADCRQELEEIGMVVEMSKELKLREPEDEYWDAYWKAIHRRVERKGGFLLLILGSVALILFALFKAITSPRFLSFTGLAVAVVVLGFFLVFLSIAKESYYERRNDPYRKVKR